MKARVLTVHAAYQHRGGEDSVIDSEETLLREHGHDVRRFARNNADIASMGRADLVVRTLWSREAARAFSHEIERFRPDVVHVHNTFPLISPAIYWVADRYGVPVVQTLHNFRLLCPQAMFLREGRVCEDCLGHLPWRGAVRGCYRGSVTQSTVLAGMIGIHRYIGTWRDRVTRYIALNEFCRGKFIEGGLPSDRIVVKPNFVDFPAPLDQAREGLLFVGRLSPEKGVATLAEALALDSAIQLAVAGSGEEADRIRVVPGVMMLGSLKGEEIRERMSGAVALVLPSIWYENFPRTLVEAMACSLPVIASRIGALAELVEDGVTGLLFEPGDSVDLSRKMRWAIDHPDRMREMGVAARKRYDAHYTAERNYIQLADIYAEAIAARSAVPSLSAR
jgi:glycosyltransferase involved in cell wall biosynthesis